MTEKVREVSDPESAVSKELSILSAASLLKWKKNAVGPKMLGFKVSVMSSAVSASLQLLLFRKTRERKKTARKKIREKNLPSL